ncbi:hypothetical protein H2203_006181 [Taxawa tesnikishii (nom. ined.)]|nr:hypothetical protein H2203_006181 [Dothideales sp. JES 119]
MTRDLLKDEYVAGMWRRYLQDELLWRVKDHELSQRPSEYRAPTFSWASVDGEIYYSSGVGSAIEATGYLVTVEQIELDYVTNDTTGPLKGGYIRLGGTLKELRFEYDDLESDPEIKGVVNGTTLRSTVNGQRLMGTQLIEFDVMDAALRTRSRDMHLFLLPVREWSDRLTCLILDQAEDLPGAFRRLGVMVVWNKSGSSSSGNPAMAATTLAHHKNEPDLPCEKYDPITKQHTFRII